MSVTPPCRRLVVGTDFSPAAAAALRLAGAWAAARRASLELVHVAPPELPVAAEAELEAELSSQAEAIRRTNEALRCEMRLLRGPDPSASLLGRARAEPASWLVLGVEGSAAQALRRPGRVTQGACRNDSTPLLLAPPRWRVGGAGRKRRATSWRRVLVGLSGGARDRARLEAGLELARPDRPAAAHVIDLSWARCYPARARARVDEPARGAADRWLASFLELEDELVDVAGDGPELQLHLLRQGPVHRDLAGLAESQAADLLLVGSGATAALLSGLVECPILVLP